MNANTIIGLLCLDDVFRTKFFQNGENLDKTLENMPLPLSWTETAGLKALAAQGQNSEAHQAFNAVAAVLRKVGCPNPPCPYLYYSTPNPPTPPPPTPQT